MQVRCGRCRTEFPVESAGRYACPTCGAVNQVRGADSPDAGFPGTAPPVQPDVPSPRVSCTSCSFSFIVGDIAVAVCPNCEAEVTVRRGSG